MVAPEPEIKYREFAKLLCRGSRSFGIDLDDAALKNLFFYFQELKRWSQKMNLIARDTADQVIVENHFIDSLALLMLLDEKQDHLLDIGSGAGFPGLVCKTVRPLMPVSLVEPRLKRVSFLRHVIRSCDLEGITVQPCRLEEGVALEDESRFNCIVSRAVSDIPDFLTLCERFRDRDKRVICMKGPGFREDAGGCLNEHERWQLTGIHEYKLPYSGASRALLSFSGHDGRSRMRDLNQ